MQVTLFRAAARTPQQALWAQLLHQGQSTSVSRGLNEHSMALHACLPLCPAYQLL